MDTFHYLLELKQEDRPGYEAVKRVGKEVSEALKETDRREWKARNVRSMLKHNPGELETEFDRAPQLEEVEQVLDVLAETELLKKRSELVNEHYEVYRFSEDERKELLSAVDDVERIDSMEEAMEGLPEVEKYRRPDDPESYDEDQRSFDEYML